MIKDDLTDGAQVDGDERPKPDPSTRWNQQHPFLSLRITLNLRTNSWMPVQLTQNNFDQRSRDHRMR